MPKLTQKELQLILQEGERYKVEFKENSSGLDREIVAFANASDGRQGNVGIFNKIFEGYCKSPELPFDKFRVTGTLVKNTDFTPVMVSLSNHKKTFARSSFI